MVPSPDDRKDGVNAEPVTIAHQFLRKFLLPVFTLVQRSDGFAAIPPPRSS